MGKKIGIKFKKNKLKMELIKEFNLFGKIKEKEEVLEVVKEFDLDLNSSMNDIFNFYNKILNKKIEFEGNSISRKGGKFKIVVRRIETKIKSNREYNINFYDEKNNRYGYDLSRPLSIYGIRKITKDDPYGEENWTE